MPVTGCTILGCGRLDILACTALESWPVHPHDSLGSDGDTVNPTNQRAIQHTHFHEGLFRRLATRFSGR